MRCSSSFRPCANYVEHVYTTPVAKSEEGKAKGVVEELFRHYCAHLEELPEEFLLRREIDGEKTGSCDYIACMTDNYAIRDFERLFVPKSWA